MPEFGLPAGFGGGIACPAGAAGGSLHLTGPIDQIILRRMDSELKGLEEKLNRFIDLCHQLRMENLELRQTVAVKTDENKRLGEKIDEARRQIESLLSMIPE